MKNMFLFIRFATSKRMGCNGDVLIFEIFFLFWSGRKAPDQEGRLDAEQQSDRNQTNFTGLRVD